MLLLTWSLDHRCCNFSSRICCISYCNCWLSCSSVAFSLSTANRFLRSTAIFQTVSASSRCSRSLMRLLTSFPISYIPQLTLRSLQILPAELNLDMVLSDLPCDNNINNKLQRSYTKFSNNVWTKMTTCFRFLRFSLISINIRPALVVMMNIFLFLQLPLCNFWRLCMTTL